MESSRTHFEILDLGLEGQALGLEASSPRKLPWPRLEDSTIFCIVKILLENARNPAENLRRPFLFSSFGDRLKNIFEDLIFENTCAWALGPWPWPQHFFPWPRKVLSSEGLPLALDFFCVLGLEPCVLDSSSDNYHKQRFCENLCMFSDACFAGLSKT